MTLLGRLLYQGRVPRLARRLRRLIVRLEPDRVRGQSSSELAARGVDPGLLGRPNRGVARLVELQLRRVGDVARHRARIVALYDEQAGLERRPEPFVRYPLLVDDPERFEEAFRREGWEVSGRWFSGVLHPEGAHEEQFGYRHGLAPNGERLAHSVVNLPTHVLVSDDDARRLITLALAQGARPLEFRGDDGQSG